TDVPANAPLQLEIRNEGDGPEYFLFDRDRMFKPGEVRENDRLRPQRASPTPVARPPVPLVRRIETLCRDVRPSGMHALVVLQGDHSGNVATVTGRLFDEDQVGAVLRYLPLRVEAAQLKTEAATLAGYGWPMPVPGEIVLVALSGDRATIATR